MLANDQAFTLVSVDNKETDALSLFNGLNSGSGQFKNQVFGKKEVLKLN